MGFVYCVALAFPLGTIGGKTAKYYIGSCKNLKQRMAQHRSGKGSAMLRAANERGINYQIVKLQICETEAQARALEKKLKRFKDNRYVLSRDWSQYLTE